MMITLERVDGRGHDRLNVDDGDYVLDSSGNLLGFAVWDHDNDDVSYFRVFKLRYVGHNHDHWFHDLLREFWDLSRPARWANTLSSAGDRLGGHYGGPRGASRGYMVGLLSGGTLGAFWPYLRNHFFHHYESARNQNNDLCYVDGEGNELYYGPIRL
jgi:hypothetical protein